MKCCQLFGEFCKHFKMNFNANKISKKFVELSENFVLILENFNLNLEENFTNSLKFYGNLW